MIARKTFRCDFITVFGTFLYHRSKTVSDLDSLDGIDPHHRRSDFRIQFPEQRITQTDRHTGYHHVDFRANGIPCLAQGVHPVFKRRDQDSIVCCGKKRIARRKIP